VGFVTTKAVVLRLGLGELHDPAAAALEAVHHEQEEQDDQQDRQEAGDERPDDARLRDLDVVGDAGVVLLHRAEHLDALLLQPVRLNVAAVLERRLNHLIAVDEGDVLDLVLVDVRHHLGRRDVLGAVAGGDRLEDDQDQNRE
jgi:hypothetical protein